MNLRHAARLAFALCLGILPARAAEPQLTIYNQNFAVVRVLIPLHLAAGENRIQYNDTTAYLEPDSVILRDPTGGRVLQILEQSYRADPASEQRLLALYEGKTIDFQVRQGDHTEIVQGKIIRSGYTVPWQNNPYGYPYSNNQPGALQPIIEVAGKLMFQLPGTPLFPSLTDESILKPQLNWVIVTDKPGDVTAEFSYVTGQIDWNADYNLVAPEEGDHLELIGWVDVHNHTGKTFENAHIKLMAGDVNKIQPPYARNFDSNGIVGGVAGGMIGGPGQVSEKPFEDYHLYELHRPATIHDQESKQVEFVRAAGIKSDRLYVYDGMKVDQNMYRGWGFEAIRNNPEYGTQSNPDVWVMREFANSEANHLGMPLPAGRVRFYRQDSDGQLEFTGENEIKHTPRDETIRVFTGDAFDIKGERRRTDFHNDMGRRMIDESFEIKLRNHKKEAAVVRVVEHMYRGATWEITEKSATFLKADAQTIEFQVQVPPDEEKTVTYTVHYTW